MRKIILISMISFISFSIFAQKIITGQVNDQQKKPISYVNIGVKNSKIGTVSNLNGEFSLQIPDSLLNDTLTFSSVGFEIKKFVINHIKEQDLNVTMEDKAISLKAVHISNRKRKTYKIGITGRTPIVFIPSSSYQINDIMEHARLLDVKEQIQILNANIFVLSPIKEDVWVRINFYTLENGLPGKLLIEKNIIKQMKHGKGWQTFDLTDENIYLDKDFVLSFECLPSARKTIAFGAKIGSANSFIRNNSLGIWRKNAAAGCSIYVTVKN